MCLIEELSLLLGTRSLTLSEMRNVIISADRRRSMSRHYIKARKIKKAFGSEILSFMKLLKVDKRIAEALNGSLNKCNDLIVTDVDDIWKVTETKTNYSFYVRNNKNWSCSCGKLTNCGLPCSHIMKVMKNKDILMETLGKLISPRWVISNQKLELSLISKSDELTDF